MKKERNLEEGVLNVNILESVKAECQAPSSLSSRWRRTNSVKFSVSARIQALTALSTPDRKIWLEAINRTPACKV